MTKAELEQQIATAQTRFGKLVEVANHLRKQIDNLLRERGQLCNFFRYYFEAHEIELPTIDGEEQILKGSYEDLSDEQIAGLADNLYCIMLNTSNILGMLY